MLMRAIALFSFLFFSTAANAWWDEGHMRIAAMTYELLTPAAKAEANRLIKLNPKYGEWAAAVPPKADGTPGDVARFTFVRAAVWADDIKGYKPYRDASKNDAPTTTTAGQNIGYGDLLIHGYWHYKDLGFTTDHTLVADADPVNIVTQIELFTAALPASAGKSDDIRSYDLAWLLHLVGDIHQPLHATALFNRDLSLRHQLRNEADTGDQGGNLIDVVPATGETVNLHAYWDGQFGGYSTVSGALFDTFSPNSGSAGRFIPKILWAPVAQASISDPNAWIQESAEIARTDAYTDAVLEGNGAVALTREYETQARETSERQIALAAARMANLLNTAFQ